VRANALDPRQVAALREPLQLRHGAQPHRRRFDGFGVLAGGRARARSGGEKVRFKARAANELEFCKKTNVGEASCWAGLDHDAGLTRHSV
jgi:hypothetical protein